MRVLSMAAPSPTTAHCPGSSPNAHCQSARAYAYPRIAEALRPRPLVHDPLLLAMLPPGACPEAAHELEQCNSALRAAAAAVEAGAALPEPRRTLQPRPDTPLVLRSSLMDRFFDDQLLYTVHSLRCHLARVGAPPGVQVVDLGCGLGTRPWRLPLGPDVCWFDIDLPAVLEEKGGLLEAAGAQTQLPPPNSDLAGEPAGSGNGSSRGAAGGDFPLQVGAYSPVVCHMLKGSLQEALEAHGWRRGTPTIWLAFALINYLDSRSADLLMRAVAAASVAAPVAVAGTVMNAAMVDMIRESVAAAGAAAVPGEHPSPTIAEATATIDPEMGGSMDFEDALRRSAGVQSAATALKFGVRGDVAAFLRLYGWEHADVVTPFQMEQMYGVLGVGLNYPADLRARMFAKHGRPPTASVALGRRGF